MTLGDALAAVLGGGTPSRHVAEFWGGEIPWATVKDLRAARLSSTEERITTAGLQDSSARLVPRGTVVIATRMAVGRVAWTDVDVAINQDLKALIAGSALHPRFLFHFMVANQARLESMGIGTTVSGISLDMVRNLPLHLPPEPEQRAIATVLDAVDETIERAEAAIAATESLRQALLHELLTRGLRGRHIEWKQVRGLGVVPGCWAVRTLRDLLVLDQPGTWGSEPDAQHSDVVVRAADFTGNGQLDVAHAPRRSVPASDRTRRLLRDGDIVVERSGGGPGNPVGRIAFVRGIGRVYCSSFCQQLRVDDSRCVPSFVALALEYRHRRGLTVRMEQRTTGIRNLDYDAYSSFPFPVPPVEEQRRIAEVLEATDEHRLRLADAVDSLRVVKSTASDALLQGRIRVPERFS